MGAYPFIPPGEFHDTLEVIISSLDAGNACPFRTVFALMKAGTVHPATTSNMPPRSRGLLGNAKCGSSKLIRPNNGDRDCKIPIVHGSLYNKIRMYLIDTGASNDVVPSAHARRLFPECVRKLIERHNFNTANGPTEVSDGVRIKMGS